ncbi:MAG: hypothetical protein IJJ33_13850 [Victivallales bacterium]|nr:hypothetical protein [Victivallales bacterium]
MQAFGAAETDVRDYYRYWRKKVWDERLAPAQADITEKGKVFNFGRGLLWNLGKYYRESDFTESPLSTVMPTAWAWKILSGK